jgi:hypothetical protein
MAKKKKGNPQGTHREPNRFLFFFKGTCQEPDRFLEGSCQEPDGFLAGSCREPVRNLSGTLQEPDGNPLGTRRVSFFFFAMTASGGPNVRWLGH